MILCLETATNLCSVALCNSAGIISLRESNDARSHASKLTVFIEDILKEHRIKANVLEAVAVSKGPGSYTGLRIGVSAAKGIAYAAKIPLIGIETTKVMVTGLIENRYKNLEKDDTLYCPMLDARRMEVYYAIYDRNGNVIKNISAEVINENSFSAINESRKLIIFGDGSEKCRNVVKRANVYFEDEYRISAAHMISPAYMAFNNNEFEDIAYFEPFYLKDFIATKPGKNILGNRGDSGT
jgi:tRNA threonylcarbamoyladenosine biosynthesis protein TsaB